LSRGILAGARAADAGGNLFPVGHFLACIVTAERLVGQQTPYGLDFFFAKAVYRLLSRSACTIDGTAFNQYSFGGPLGGV
jgi:hypothetical protein